MAKQFFQIGMLGLCVLCCLDCIRATVMIDHRTKNDASLSNIDAAIIFDYKADQARENQLLFDVGYGRDNQITLDARPTNSCQAGWCTIAAGSFYMGSPLTEACRYDLAETRHQVVLSRPIKISATEVTQQDFQTLLSYNPSAAFSCGGYCPVEQVSWSEAATYCNALSAKEGLAECYSCIGSGSPSAVCTVNSNYETGGKTIYDCPGYRLPTDAEWEYAYRAGTTTSFYNGEVEGCLGVDNNANQIAWYAENSSGSVHPVGQKLSNPWGLYDMAGNVWEWTNDFYQADLGTNTVTDPLGPSSGLARVIRGGSVGPTDCCAVTLRAAFRGYAAPENKNNKRGFRCVKSTTN